MLSFHIERALSDDEALLTAEKSGRI